MRMIQLARSEIGTEETARNATTCKDHQHNACQQERACRPESSENYLHVTHHAGDSDAQIEAEDHAMLSTAQQRSKAEARNRGGERVVKPWRP